MAFEFTITPGIHTLGVAEAGTPTSLSLDSAWVCGTSGDAVYVRVFAPVAQTSAALTAYFFCTDVTAGGAEVTCELRGISAADGSKPLATTILATSNELSLVDGVDNNTWLKFDFTGVTLTQGAAYWLIVYNSHATPTTYYPDIQYKPATYATDSYVGTRSFTTIYVQDGFAGTPPSSTWPACCVVKFGDGTLIGWPYVTGPEDISSASYRGVRLTLPGPAIVSGIYLDSSSTTGLATFKVVRVSDSVTIVTATPDLCGKSRRMVRFAPTLLEGGVPYDVVATVSASSAYGYLCNMGETEANVPADVLACRPMSWAYVLGTTPDTSKMLYLWSLMIDKWVSGGGMLVHPGMDGGMRG